MYTLAYSYMHLQTYEWWNFSVLGIWQVNYYNPILVCLLIHCICASSRHTDTEEMLMSTF